MKDYFGKTIKTHKAWENSKQDAKLDKAADKAKKRR